MCHVSQRFFSQKQLVSITDDGDEKSNQIFVQGSNFHLFRRENAKISNQINCIKYSNQGLTLLYWTIKFDHIISQPKNVRI